MKRSIIILIVISLLIVPSMVSCQILPSGPRLRDLADQAGLLLGIRAFLRNDAQEAIVEREFNTATRTCYPVEIDRSPSRHDLDNFNTGINWLHERDMKPMHHMLFGPSQYESGWVTLLTSPATLDSLMQERIRIIMESNDNAAKVNVWNVVNETFNWNTGNEGDYFGDDMLVWIRIGYEDDRSGLTGNDRINEQHPVYIRKAFEYASKYATGKLELRDNNCERPGRKTDALYQLVKHLQNSGTRIDAVGLQCHFTIEGPDALDPEGLATVIRRFRELGVEVYLTEVDFSRDNLPWTNALSQQQKEEYKKLITVALEEGVEQVHIWGLRDADEEWHGDVNPLLFDENLLPKPAYYGVQEALLEFIENQR